MSKRRLAIIGGGGHGRVAAEAARLANYSLGFILPDGSARSCINGYPVWGTDSNLGNLGSEIKLLVAIGDNWLRSQAVQRIQQQLPDASFASVVHPKAIISSDAIVGPGSLILAGAIVNPGSRIGNHCIVNTGSIVEHDNEIGFCASLGPKAVTGGTVRIGDYTAIGIGSTVIHGINIGSHVVVGAASLVVKDLPDNVISYGVPAKVIRSREVGDPYL